MIRIGEKLNGAIGAVAAAIAARDAAALQERARQQAAAGADYLDLCAAVSEDELPALRFMIESVQAVSDLPLCIDSPDPRVCAAAMACCARPGIVNSISMEGEKAELLLPAVAGTDWGVIALLCDERGIPDSAAGRLAVLERILRRAAHYGVPERSIYVDPMVEALSANPRAFLIFLDCVREIRAQHPQIHIVSGLSNISFGLPARKSLHGAFFQLAREAGMDAAICDPAVASLPVEPLAVEALMGRDPGCRNYIAAHTRGRGTEAAQSARERLMAAVSEGEAERTAALTEAALASGETPLSLLEGMTAAMAALGERFAAGEAFIPELIMAAKAMQAASAVLKPLLGADAASRGTVVIGTVMGDMHDIGKNLVAMLLEGAGFTVIDLGTDVYPEDIIETVEEHPETKIVALSALLTTTMPAMRDTVAALRQAPCCAGIKIMVGGAPVTEAFARAIGADVYTDNAAAAAEAAKALVE